MATFRAPGALHEHPAARAAGLAALGLWTMAGTWSAQHHTGGFLPAPAIYELGNNASRGHAARLVTAGLWAQGTMDRAALDRHNQWWTYGRALPGWCFVGWIEARGWAGVDLARLGEPAPVSVSAEP